MQEVCDASGSGFPGGYVCAARSAAVVVVVGGGVVIVNVSAVPWVGETALIEGASSMGQQSIRQAARRAALDAQAQRRRERAEREKRIETLALDVLTALEERKAAVADCEARAGLALRKLTVDEGLSTREAVDWCGSLSNREAARLLHAAEASGPLPN